MMKILILLVILFTTTFFSVKIITIERIQANVELKQLDRGKSITLKSQIFYQSNGDCVTHYTYPVEYFVITNKLGEVKIYDPSKNTVLVEQNNVYSSKTSPFYYFLSGKSNDMGLADFGFTPSKTYSEKSNIVSEWKKKKVDIAIPVQMVKLVHQQQNPIYMEYRSDNSKILRKVYYYNYTKLNQFDFPTTTTDIVFSTKTKDSVINKTTYTDIKLNDEATGNFFAFKIPATAKKIN